MKTHIKYRFVSLLALCIMLALTGCDGLPLFRHMPRSSDTGVVSTLENPYKYPDGSYMPGVTGSYDPSSNASVPTQLSGQTIQSSETTGFEPSLTTAPTTIAVVVQTAVPTKPPAVIATTSAPSSPAATTLPAVVTPAVVPPTVVPPTATPTMPAATVDSTILSLMTAGLDAGSREIDLSSFLAMSPVSLDQIPDVLLRVQSIYHALLDDRPDFYYLDGSNTLHYEITGGTRMSSISIVIGTRDAYDSWTSADMVSARLALIAKADEIAGMAAGLPAWQQLLVIHDTLVQRVTYDTTLNQDTNNAAGALLDGSTLCQGYAQAFQLAAQRCGLDVSLISGTAEGVSHAWNLVRLDGKTYHVDVTFDDPVAPYDLSPVVFHSHFLRSDSAMKSTHAWSQANYPACPADGAQFYQHNGWTASTRDTLRQKVMEYFGARELGDSVNDTLEILYTGSDVPSDTELANIFHESMSALSIGRTYSYVCSMEKNVAQLVLFKP